MVYQPNQKYKKEIDEEYEKMRNEITGEGKRLPYQLYVKKRALYWLKNVAKLHDLPEAEKIILDRRTDHSPT